MKCPKCDQVVDKNENDIVDTQFRGTFERHYAYVCRKCVCLVSVQMQDQGEKICERTSDMEQQFWSGFR